MRTFHKVAALVRSDGADLGDAAAFELQTEGLTGLEEVGELFIIAADARVRFAEGLQDLVATEAGLDGGGLLVGEFDGGRRRAGRGHWTGHWTGHWIGG